MMMMVKDTLIDMQGWVRNTGIFDIGYWGKKHRNLSQPGSKLLTYLPQWRTVRVAVI